MKMEREVQLLNLDDILPNRFQPRITFDEKAIMELSASIKEHGVIQPIVVRKIGDKFEIIAGERRYKASVLAGKNSIPAIIADLNDKDSAEIALIENVQRQDLTPIEEAVSYKKILDMGYLNQSDLASKLGKTQSTIANKLRLLNLSDEVQEALLEERISERHARSLLRLNKRVQNNMLDRIISERMTVRKTDEEIIKLLQDESNRLDFESDGGQKEMNNQQNNINPIVNIQQTQKNSDVEQNSTLQVQPVVESLIPQKNLFTINQQPVAEVNSIKSVQSIPSQTLQPIVSPVDTRIDEYNLPVEKVENIPAQGRFFQTITQEQPIEPIQASTSIFDQPTLQSDPFRIEVPSEPIVEVQAQPVVEYEKQMPMEISMQIEKQGLNAEAIPEIKPYELDDNINFNPAQSVVELGGTGIRTEEPVLQPIMNVGPIPTKANLKEAINMVRNCSKQIENMGFKIEVEELDFQTAYQVNFIIEK